MKPSDKVDLAKLNLGYGCSIDDCHELINHCLYHRKCCLCHNTFCQEDDDLEKEAKQLLFVKHLWKSVVFKKDDEKGRLINTLNRMYL